MRDGAAIGGGAAGGGGCVGAGGTAVGGGGGGGGTSVGSGTLVAVAGAVAVAGGGKAVDVEALCPAVSPGEPPQAARTRASAVTIGIRIFITFRAPVTVM